jgi:hypothetical protein
MSGAHEVVLRRTFCEATMTDLLVSGKILETVGASFIAYVGARACALEVRIWRRIRQHSIDPEAFRHEAQDAVDRDLERLRKGLETIWEHRQRQFGFYESILVASGTVAIALGCALYLAGLLQEPPH